MSSSSSAPPGQRSGEVPNSLKYDNVVGFVWAGFMLLFPPMIVDSDKILPKRFWAWRYIYLGFGLISAAFFYDVLVQSPSVALLFPFAHVLAAISVGTLFADFTVPGLSLPMVSYSTTVILYAISIGIVFSGELLRRTSPEMLAMNRWDHDEGESVVPLEEVSHEHNEAEMPFTLDQDVSTAVVGETGSGKTSMMKLLAYQFPYYSDTAVIAHDTGEDFQEFYEELGFEVQRIRHEDSDVVWNLFKDADSEADFREVAGAIFGEADGHDPFHRPAKQTFAEMLMYLHLSAKKNNRRHALCHADIVSLLNEGHIALKEALDEFDRLESGHIDPDKGKGAQNVYQTIKENVDPVFTGDFGDYGEFSLQEYIENPEGRVLIIDSNPTELETLGPMYQLLADWSIRYAMNASNPTVHILDEIDALPSLTQVTNLTARGRKHKARALVGVQTIGQLKDTYSTISGIVGNCPQGVYFGPGDTQSTDFILDELGESRQYDRSEMVSMSHQGRGENPRTQARDTYKEKDKTPITSGLLRDFQPGECVAVSRTTWVHGQSYELADVRDSLPEQGAESPGSSEPEPSEDDTELEEHDSWLSLAQSQLGELVRESDGEIEDADSKDSEPDRDPDVEPTLDVTDGLADDDSSDPLDQTTANTAVTSPDADHLDLSDSQDESDGTDQDQNPTDNVGDFSPDESPNLSDDGAESAEQIDSESPSESDAAETEDQDKTESEERGHDPAGFM
ncbi:type IV secretory system conjugative DNA transfer family protein [Haloarcula argentinensis]|uniref:Type IV secretion system DNA-binding domain-containing protein n=1 Tax=Haloarcula argentinensis TaxID=43776 RepID=A0ABU2F5W8_HALAR|nr:putative conjugative transfer protein TraD [Haloarcula argentinensis DSM 12282]MDS0255962.1 type IV secretion system DNA-binding domain-containing protein [Haloarcula argentinensis]